ncbi:acetyl-CoA carboxylase biotin carboxylase subunit family protein [Streptomyces sp. NPDC004111]|uniref:ATP-grasp domain-containing protein n=1 Tax=Streptomyces sp. NPDC004111 TaxID=3364690 RepID=UPI0036C866E6
MPTPRHVVLVVAPSEEVAEGYRSYCLAHIAAAYDVVLVTSEQPTWEAQFIVDSEVADPLDEQALAAAGLALAARHQVAGVMTWTEDYLVQTARLATVLGLPTSSPESMLAARDKASSRREFARHHVPSADSMTVTSLVEAAVAAETIGYPVVVKPAAGMASIGVRRVNTAEELFTAYDAAAVEAGHAIESTQVLIEAYLDGPEVSVECVTHQGRTSVVAVTRKKLGEEPHFEEVAHSVEAGDPLLATVAPVATAAVQALGIDNGIQHVEMRLVAGKPHLIEVNGRIGGDMIGHLVHRATGISLPRAAADIACGIAPDLTATRTEAAAVRLLYPDTSGTLSVRQFPGRPTDRPPWLERLHWQRQVGDAVLLPQDGGDRDTARLGYVITAAPTAALAQARADEVSRTLLIGVEPAAQPQQAATGATCAS